MKVKKEIPTGRRHLQQRDGAAQPERVEDVVDVERDEAVVLEPAEEPEQHADDDAHGDAPATLVAATLWTRRRRRWRSSSSPAGRGVPPVPPGVEDVAERDHERLPRTREGASSQFRTKTIPKKIAKSIVGKSIGAASDLRRINRRSHASGRARATRDEPAVAASAPAHDATLPAACPRPGLGGRHGAQ